MGRSVFPWSGVAVVTTALPLITAGRKTENKTDKVKGKVKDKETMGKVTGNEKLEAEGKKDQTKGDLKQVGEKVKDAFKKD